GVHPQVRRCRMGRGFVTGGHVDLQLDGLLPVQFGRADDRELAVSDLGADAGRIASKPEDELPMALTPDVPEWSDPYARTSQPQPALVEVGGVVVDVVLEGSLGGHSERVLPVFVHPPVRADGRADTDMDLLLRAGIRRVLPPNQLPARCGRVQDVAAGVADGR